MRRLACLFAVSLQLVSAPVLAQIVTDWPSVAVATGSTCADAPIDCQAASFVEDLGVFDAFVYALNSDNGGYPELSECALAVTWPPEWHVLGIGICNGTVIEMSTPVPGRLDVRLGFSPCVLSGVPILHLRMDATSVGRLQLAPTVQGAFEYRPCGPHPAQPYWAGSGDDYAHIDVGNICGGTPMNSPCDYCTLHYGLYRPATSFEPSSLSIEIEQGQVGVDTVVVTTGVTCTQIPECGGGWPQFCFDGIQPLAEWLSFEHIGSPGPDLATYEVRIDATALPAGIHDGAAEVEGGGCCQAVCWPVQLTVVHPTAVEATTWGQIKATYPR